MSHESSCRYFVKTWPVLASQGERSFARGLRRFEIMCDEYIRRELIMCLLIR